MINSFNKTLAKSLLDKRQAVAKSDPREEIVELHFEIQEYERQFKECVEIAQFCLESSKELRQIVDSNEALSQAKMA